MNDIRLFTRPGWGGTFESGLDYSDRQCHTYILGKTGSGKSTLLRNLLAQEIEGNRGVGLIDPHGDLAVEIMDLIPRRRTDDVVYFCPGDLEFPCALNVLRSGGPPHLVASSIVSALKNIWRESWGPRLEYILYAAVSALAECENVSILGIPRLLTDEGYRAWVVRQVHDPLVRTFWAVEFESYDKRFRNEAISPILNKVGQFLMSPVIRNILGQVRNAIDFGQILDREQIFIANLSKAHLGEEKANLLGSLLVSQFQLAAMARGRRSITERSDFSLVIDEFHNFITESFCSILSESRKYGLHMTLSHQYLDQLLPEIRQAVLGNSGSLISFRLGHADAARIADELGSVSPEQLADLARFEIAAKLQVNNSQGEPFFARTLEPLGTEYGASRSIIHRSRQRFSSKRDDVERKTSKWIIRRAEDGMRFFP